MKNEEWGLLRGESLSFKDVSLSFKVVLILKATPKASLSAKMRDNSLGNVFRVRYCE